MENTEMIYKIHHNKDYTCISNSSLKDKNLSLAAKGLLVSLLSLPEDWEFSVNGLNNIINGNIRTPKEELQKNGYLHIYQNRENGKIKDWTWDIFEESQNVNFLNQHAPLQHVSQQHVKNEHVENDNIYKINNELNKQDNKINNISIGEAEASSIKKDTKHKYGEYNHVLFTDEEYEKLKAEFPNNYNEWIAKVDNYCETSGKTYKNYLAVIRNWANKDFLNSYNKQKQSNYLKPKTWDIPKSNINNQQEEVIWGEETF